MLPGTNVGLTASVQAVMVVTTASQKLAILSLDQIDAFPGDPRIVINPEYDRIRDSIQANGLDQPLIVSPAQKGARYVIAAGGNTRLHILKRLAEESRAENASEVRCIVQETSTEAETLLAHLRENDLRGNLSFIEKALAIEAVKAQWEPKITSQRRLASVLSSVGFAIDQSTLSRMCYAAMRLYPLMPDALKVGMGRPAVDAIRRLESGASALWEKWELGTAVSFEETFVALCEKANTFFEFERLQRDVEYEVAQAADCPLEVAVLALASAMDGEVPPPPELSDESSVPLPEGDSRDKVAPIDRPTGDDSWTSDEALIEESDAKSGSSEPPISEDMRLRRTAYQLARRLGDRYGLIDLLQPTEDDGIGFILADFPDEILIERLECTERATLSLMWWTLAALCELTTLPASRIEALMSPDGLLSNALLNGGLDTLRERVNVDPSDAGRSLWAQMDDQSWDDFLALLKLYRRLRNVHWASTEKTAS